MVEHALRSTLLFLSRQEELKDVATKLSPLQALARRFVAGEDREDALEAGRALNAQGCTATFDHLGEDVQSAEATKAELREYQALLGRIEATGVRANVSVKLSQLGLGLDPELAFENARSLVAFAKQRGIFVRLDMEGSALTQATLDLFTRLRGEFGVDDVGVAVQAYLRRTRADVEALLRLPARIRLCKGAYKEPPEVAFPEKAEVDRRFVALTRRLLESGRYHGIATHDPKMVDAAKRYAARHDLPPGAFEFQMLHGVRRDLQQALAREGYPVRVYVPYGESWYPYLMRRLAERPANLWFMVKNLARG